MTTGTGKPSSRVERMMDRDAALRMVRAMLDGSGLVVRALKSGLVITNPHDRDKGRIHIDIRPVTSPGNGPCRNIGACFRDTRTTTATAAASPAST
jgi:hypothetical protein